MIKKLILLFTICHVVCHSYAQTLNVSTHQLNFGNVYETNSDSLPLTISNPLNRNVLVTGFQTFGFSSTHYYIHGNPPFSVSPNSFTILPGDSITVWVKFSPRQNIFHNSEMIIVNNSLRGAISIDLRGQGKYSNHYYDATENLFDENLKTAIKTISGNGYISLLYNPARDSMFMQIDNKRVNGQGASQNTLECIYTGRQAIGYTDRADCQTNDTFNTEHTFPQSFFSSMEPMKSDLHHLFPTDDVANNQRGNNPFGVVNTGVIWSNGGSKSDGAMFEPRDVQKGPTSRALLYFVLRYQDYSGFVNPQESILRTWHYNFLPDAVEKKRNDDIFAVQNNRNAFVDYPEFVDRITSITSNSVLPNIVSLIWAPDTINYGTVSAGIPTIYDFVLVNSCTTDLYFNTFNLTHPAELSFISGGNDTMIAPGESLTLHINCLVTNTDSIRAFLSFKYGSIANPTHPITVPIYVNDLVYNEIAEVKNDFLVSPNPAHDRVYVSSTNSNIKTEISIYDLQGRLMYADKNFNGKGFIEVGNFSKGIYLLQLKSLTGIVNKKVVIE